MENKTNTILTVVIIILAIIAWVVYTRQHMVVPTMEMQETYRNGNPYNPNINTGPTPTGQTNTLNNPSGPDYNPNPIVIPSTPSSMDKKAVIKKIQATDNGPLSECNLNNRTYFFARGSMFDGSDNIYDNQGNSVAKCGGGWGVRPSPYPQICTQMYATQCSNVPNQ